MPIAACVVAPARLSSPSNAMYAVFPTVSGLGSATWSNANPDPVPRCEMTGLDGVTVQLIRFRLVAW